MRKREEKKRFCSLPQLVSFQLYNNNNNNNNIYNSNTNATSANHYLVYIR